jgi:hypothetical protein
MSRSRKILEARRQEIEAALTSLQTELEEVKRALAAVDRTAGNKSRSHPSRTKPIKVLMREILSAHPEGLQLLDIVDLLEKHGRSVSRRNTSGYLSNLKKEGKITSDGDLWKLA